MFKKIIAWYTRPNKSYIADTLESLIVIIPMVFLIRTCLFGLYQVPTCSMEPTMLVGDRFIGDKLTPYFSSPKHGDIVAFNDPLYQYSENPVINFYERYVSFSITSWTKRVIGIPGDHIEGRIEDNQTVIYRNGERLDEPYVNSYPIIELYNPDQINNPNFMRGFVHRTFDATKRWDDQPFYRINPADVVRAKQLRSKTVFCPHEPTAKDVFDVHLGENEYWMMGDNRQGSGDSRSWGPLKGNHIHAKILFRIWSLDSDESWFFIDMLKHPIDFWTRLRWSRFLNILY